MKIRSLVVTVLVTAAVQACGAAVGPNSGTSPAPSGAPGSRDCRSLTFPFPPADADLGARDNGKTANVKVGGLVAVALLGQGKHWQPVKMSGAGLVQLSTQAATATVGTQLAEYCAVSKGRSTLISRNEEASWTAVVEVQ